MKKLLLFDSPNVFCDHRSWIRRRTILVALRTRNILSQVWEDIKLFTIVNTKEGSVEENINIFSVHISIDDQLWMCPNKMNQFKRNTTDHVFIILNSKNPCRSPSSASSFFGQPFDGDFFFSDSPASFGFGHWAECRSSRKRMQQFFLLITLQQ